MTSEFYTYGFHDALFTLGLEKEAAPGPLGQAGRATIRGVRRLFKMKPRAQDLNVLRPGSQNIHPEVADALAGLTGKELPLRAPPPQPPRAVHPTSSRPAAAQPKLTTEQAAQRKADQIGASTPAQTAAPAAAPAETPAASTTQPPLAHPEGAEKMPERVPSAEQAAEEGFWKKPWVKGLGWGGGILGAGYLGSQLLNSEPQPYPQGYYQSGFGPEYSGY